MLSRQSGCTLNFSSSSWTHCYNDSMHGSHAPVYIKLLRGDFEFFSPSRGRGDTLHRCGWNLAWRSRLRIHAFTSLNQTRDVIYTVFHKIWTHLHFCNNILPCGQISIDIPNCSAENWLEMCDTFTYLTFIHFWKSYSDYFTFQQDGAPAHQAHKTVENLKSRDARLYSTEFVAT